MRECLAQQIISPTTLSPTTMQMGGQYFCFVTFSTSRPTRLADGAFRTSVTLCFWLSRHYATTVDPR
jgi:hypothetical protein